MRKKSPRVQGESAESATSPLGDLPPSGPSGGHAQVPAPPASPASGAPALKRRRKLGAPLVNGSGLPTLAWPLPGQEGPPASPVDGGGHPDPLPKGKKLKKKKGEPSSLDLYGLATQKSAVFKKKKKGRAVVNLVEHNRVLESELRLVQALVRRPGSGVWGCAGARSALWATERSWLITHLICQHVSEQVSHVHGLGSHRSPPPALYQATHPKVQKGHIKLRALSPRPKQAHCPAAEASVSIRCWSCLVFFSSWPTLGPDLSVLSF